MQSLEKKTIHCPNCQKKLQFTPAQVDRNAACPSCKSAVAIPAHRVVVPEVANVQQFNAPFPGPIRPARMSFRTKAEIALVVLLLSGGTAWLSRAAFSQSPRSSANSVTAFDQRRMYSLLAETKELEEKREELTARIKSLKGELEALDQAIQQSLHSSKIKVSEVLAAFEKDSHP